MGSAEIARTTDEMEAEMDVVMDAKNGDAMDAKTTDEMTNQNDAEILETETREPHTGVVSVGFKRIVVHRLGDIEDCGGVPDLV